MSESDHLLAAIECCGARAKIAQGKLDQFTLMPSDASSERTYRKLKEDWREATEHAEHLRRRLGGFSGARLQNDRLPTLRPFKHTFAVSILSIQKLLDHLMCEAAAK